MIEFCVSGLAVISVSGLSCMHTWLIARMETTNEDVNNTHTHTQTDYRILLEVVVCLVDCLD